MLNFESVPFGMRQGSRIASIKRLGILTVLGFVVGCGDGPAMAPVSGVVSLDGSPIQDLIVVFQPEPIDGGSLAPTTRSMGRTNADGQYSLSTIDVNDGAAVGRHKVSVTPDAKFGKPPGRLPAGLVVEVTAGPNTIDLELEPMR